MSINQLQPSALWQNFAAINAVPRPSKKEERIIAFMKAYGENLNLETTVDAVGNVIIRKPATSGMEDRATVVLQSHLDMVHQKNEGTNFNFDTDGIKMYVDGDWVKAEGTTLGADNGIGVAAIMALLQSTDIPHPPLEALFTIDEETGMTGAFALQGGLLQGSILLNLDTEEDDVLTIGCAGGLDVAAEGNVSRVTANGDTAYRIVVSGLTGGHSGGDIHLGRGNAIKMLTRILYNLSLQNTIELASMKGGSARNAIPREASAVIVFTKSIEDKIVATLQSISAILKDEFSVTDPLLAIHYETVEQPAFVVEGQWQQQWLNALYACPNGIYRMSPAIQGLVQSSNNLSIVSLNEKTYQAYCLTRSSVDSEKDDVKNAITAAFATTGATVTYSGNYPGWTPRPDAPIIQIMSNKYQELFGEKTHINAVHAGLECGILGINYPSIQMISFGPNITGAHSPDEKVQISSVQKFWKYLLAVLKDIPVAQ